METGVLWRRQIRLVKPAKSKWAWRSAPKQTNEEAATQLVQSGMGPRPTGTATRQATGRQQERKLGTWEPTPLAIDRLD
jgi:hypothetical protein